MIEIPQHKDYAKNLRQTEHKDGYPCIVCGRHIVSDVTPMVRVWYGAYLVTEEEAKELIEKEGWGGDTGIRGCTQLVNAV